MPGRDLARWGTQDHHSLDRCAPRVCEVGRCARMGTEQESVSGHWHWYLSAACSQLA